MITGLNLLTTAQKRAAIKEYECFVAPKDCVLYGAHIYISIDGNMMLSLDTTVTTENGSYARAFTTRL